MFCCEAGGALISYFHFLPYIMYALLNYIGDLPKFDFPIISELVNRELRYWMKKEAC